MEYKLTIIFSALVATISIVWIGLVAARRSYPQIRQLNVVAEGQSAMTGVSWHITPASGDTFRVEFSLPNFKIGMWFGIGFNQREAMVSLFFLANQA